MKKEVIVVLGSPNLPDGELGIIAKSRLDHCLSLYSKGIFILCTGGWGKQFNIGNEAHAVYAKRYLLQKGFFESDFLDPALSENSVDDAVKVKEIVSNMTNINLSVITSDFHVERAQLIFQKILTKIKPGFIGVRCDLDEKELENLIKHEKQAILSIIQNGLYY